MLLEFVQLQRECLLLKNNVLNLSRYSSYILQVRRPDLLPSDASLFWIRCTDKIIKLVHSI